MAGDPTKANLWTDADVYISFDLSAPMPASADEPFGPQWDLVGLLDGDEGFPEGREEDTDDKFAWGGILVKTSRNHFKLTKSFTALEDNEVTRKLVWPGSTEMKIVVPVPERVKVAFEVREGGKVRRLVTSLYAECNLDGDHGETETDLESATIIATIYPNANKELFDRQATPTLESIAVTPSTLSVAATEIGAAVATATYSDATTGDVTANCSWSSSDPTKATVSGGFITGIAAGTSTVTASYLGQTDTVAVTVTA